MPVILETYSSRWELIHSNTDLFLEKFTEMIEKYSNYTQFNTPVSVRKLLDKQKIFKILTEQKEKDRRIDDQDDTACIGRGGKQIDIAPLNLNKIVFSGVKIEWKTNNSYLKSLTFSDFQNRSTLEYDTDFHPHKTFNRIKLNALSTILKLEVLGIQVPDYHTNKMINVSEYQSFDATCIRLDFDPRLSQKDNSVPGISLDLTFPKLLTNYYDDLLIRSFPRKYYKTVNPISTDPVFQGFNTDYYALIYPRSLEQPFVDSEEVTRIKLEKSQKIRTFVRRTDYDFVHDFLDTSRKCSNDAKPIKKCLHDSMKCDVFSKNSSCNFGISSPIDPIDAVKEGCYPTACKQSMVDLVYFDKHKTKTSDFSSSNPLKDDTNPYLKEFFATSRQKFNEDGTVDVNKNLLNPYSIDKINAYSKIVKDCHNSFHWSVDKPRFCQILTLAEKDVSKFELYQLEISHHDSFIRTVTEVEVDTWLKFAEDVIGSLGFFLGFSIMTFVEFFMFFNDVVATYFGKRKISTKNNCDDFSGEAKVDLIK